MPDDKLTGKVDTFSDSTGWGFIDADDPDVPRAFVHHTNVRSKRGKATLHPGQRVAYRIMYDEQAKPYAVDVVALEGSTNTVIYRGERKSKIRGRIVKVLGNYGFISYQGVDVFFHMSTIPDTIDHDQSLEGCEVIFNMVPGDKGPKAIKIRLVE